MAPIEFPILSIDVGKKKVGLAILLCSDSSCHLKMILNRESKVAEKEILKLIHQKQIKTLVAGLPLDANNQKTTQCADIEAFCSRIQKRTKLEFHYVDEYLSSEEAKQQFARASRVDDHAAEIILKRFLSLDSSKTRVN